MITLQKLRVVILIAPSIGGRYNQILDAQGLSHDDVNLKDVTVTLRKGDKSSYEVPSFIQGLYLDFHVGGSTFYEVGAGLTFFDDNVKLQGLFGQLTQEQYNSYLAIFGKAPEPLRYGGTHIIGIKILANVAQLPFRVDNPPKIAGRYTCPIPTSIPFDLNNQLFNYSTFINQIVRISAVHMHRINQFL